MNVVFQARLVFSKEVSSQKNKHGYGANSVSVRIALIGKSARNARRGRDYLTVLAGWLAMTNEAILV
jgi:hypothetical protein